MIQVRALCLVGLSGPRSRVNRRRNPCDKPRACRAVLAHIACRAHARSGLLRLAAPPRGNITRAARVSLEADPRCAQPREELPYYNDAGILFKEKEPLRSRPQ